MINIAALNSITQIKIKIHYFMKKHNFNAGPSILPRIAVENSAKAVLDLNGIGLSLLEISHRSKDFQAILDETMALFKELLNIPAGYQVIFLGGGASLQFCMIPYNFLNNKAVIKQIIDCANLTVDDLVLEVGPGKGILTEELAKRCKKVVAVEIDSNLVSLLKDKFKENENVEIVNEDILKTEPLSIFKTYNLQSITYKLIANIPYYITSPVIRFFLENEFPPQEMILMVQKEVAQRITAKPGNHSILSLSVQYYANPELLFCVDKSNFDPIPEVDSAVIKVSSIMYNVSSIERDNFFRVVRAGFCAKRKMLVNNLANSFHLDKKEATEKLKAAGISGAARAQELTIEDWKRLSVAI